MLECNKYAEIFISTKAAMTYFGQHFIIASLKMVTVLNSLNSITACLMVRELTKDENFFNCHSPKLCFQLLTDFLREKKSHYN